MLDTPSIPIQIGSYVRIAGQFLNAIANPREIARNAWVAIDSGDAMEVASASFGFFPLGTISRAPGAASRLSRLGHAGVESGNIATWRLEASSPILGLQLRNRLIAEEVAAGHSFEKHVLGVHNPSGTEFAGLGIRTRAQFADHLEAVLNSATNQGTLRLGRTYFYEKSSNTVVIRNPKAIDGGTAFRIDLNRFPNPLDFINSLR